MRTFGSWAGALLLGAAMGTGCDGGPAQPTVGDGGDMARAPVCAWATAAPELTLAEGKVKGALRGSSRNRSTTCTGQKGTGGPEAIYRVRLTERTLLDIEVVSEMDTVLAIRRVCDDSLTELACSDDTGGASRVPVPGVDAGAPLPGPDARNAHLRTLLEAGTYFLLVDQAEPFGAGGEFLLDVHTSPPPAQTSCADSPLVMDGTRLVGEELDTAHDLSPCPDGEPRPALFYRAVIPPGQRLTARAVPTDGDREWTPVLKAFTSCGPGGVSDAGANLCLASGSADAQGLPVLRYVNNGPTEQTVLLAVSSRAPVKNALFRLEVDTAEVHANVTCESALPLSDGLVVRNQDLAEGQLVPACRSPSTPVARLFYSARLYPNQSVRLSVESAFRSLIEFTGGESCLSFFCNGRSGEFFYTNYSSETRTVIIEVSGDPALAVPPFDLRAEMPLPPGGISVQATEVPQTSESGGKATFQVVLTSPATGLVEIPISSSDPQEGTVTPATLRFSPEDWDRPQLVTVTGVDDDREDGRRPYTMRIGPAESNDRRYAGLEGRKVAFTNLDDEPGFRIDAPSTLFSSESGANATFRVSLNRAPTATVRLPLSSSDEGEGKVSPAELVFEPDTWNRPQTVTVLGIDDDQPDGSQPYQVLIGAASSADARYQGIDPEDLPARNADDVFHRGATPVSDPTVCDGDSDYGPSHVLAVDQASNLYVGLLCPYPYMPAPGDAFPTARVATSVDGGRSFGAPVDTGLPVYDLLLAGGRPGLVVAVGTGPQGIVVTRSEDGGATWQPMRVLNRSNGFYRLAAAGDRVLVSAVSDTPGLSFWISDDGARTFGPPKRLDVGQGSFRGWMGVDADGTLWGFTHDGRTLSFSTSNDGGTTFRPGPSLPPLFLGPVAVGPTLLYFADKELQVVPRDGSAPPHTITAIPFSNSAFSLLTDQRDNVTVLRSASGQLEAHRLNAGDSTFAPARALGAAFGGWSSAVPLSDRAIAVMLFSSGTASVAIETWP